MTLVEKLGEIKVNGYELKHSPKAFRAILLAVAGEMPEFVAEFSRKTDKQSYLFNILGYSDFVIEQLRASAKELEGK